MLLRFLKYVILLPCLWIGTHPAKAEFIGRPKVIVDLLKQSAGGASKDAGNTNTVGELFSGVKLVSQSDYSTVPADFSKFYVGPVQTPDKGEICVEATTEGEIYLGRWAQVFVNGVPAFERLDIPSENKNLLKNNLAKDLFTKGYVMDDCTSMGGRDIKQLVVTGFRGSEKFDHFLLNIVTSKGRVKLSIKPPDEPLTNALLMRCSRDTSESPVTCSISLDELEQKGYLLPAIFEITAVVGSSSDERKVTARVYLGRESEK